MIVGSFVVICSVDASGSIRALRDAVVSSSCFIDTVTVTPSLGTSNGFVLRVGIVGGTVEADASASTNGAFVEGASVTLFSTLSVNKSGTL